MTYDPAFKGMMSTLCQVHQKEEKHHCLRCRSDFNIDIITCIAVDVSQHEPLHKMSTTEKDVLVDVMAVSAQLDLLVRKELSQVNDFKITVKPLIYGH